MAEQLKEIVAILRRPKNVTQRLVKFTDSRTKVTTSITPQSPNYFTTHTMPTVLKWKEVYEKLEAAVIVVKTWRILKA